MQHFKVIERPQRVLADARRSMSQWLVSGLWSRPEGLHGTFPGLRPVVLSPCFNSTTVAGAAPEFDRLPNYPPPSRRHLEIVSI